MYVVLKVGKNKLYEFYHSELFRVFSFIFDELNKIKTLELGRLSKYTKLFFSFAIIVVRNTTNVKFSVKCINFPWTLLNEQIHIYQFSWF